MNLVYVTFAVQGTWTPCVAGEVLDTMLCDSWPKALEHHRELVEKYAQIFPREDLEYISSLQNENSKFASTTIEWKDDPKEHNTPLHLPVKVQTKGYWVNMPPVDPKPEKVEVEKKKDLPIQKVEIPDNAKVSNTVATLTDGTIMVFQVDPPDWMVVGAGNRKRRVVGRTPYIVGRLDGNSIHDMKHITEAQTIALRDVKEVFMPAVFPELSYFVGNRISSCEINGKQLRPVSKENYQVLKDLYLKWEKKYLQKKRRQYEKKHSTTKWVDTIQWCADPY